jgi:hypothetical protein
MAQRLPERLDLPQLVVSLGIIEQVLDGHLLLGRSAKLLDPIALIFSGPPAPMKEIASLLLIVSPRFD